ncbi:MAG: tRNA (adenosine(37)-N6)-threonylcarbamoyltransferase complex ATPase subunit type 1 TsaE [Ignavibacteria bacterium]
MISGFIAKIVAIASLCCCPPLNSKGDLFSNPLSPTFSIINEYNGIYKIYHFDFYRIKDIEELYDIGYEDYLNEESICLIEWANIFTEILPQERFEVLIEFVENETQRKITINKL